MHRRLRLHWSGPLQPLHWCVGGYGGGGQGTSEGTKEGKGRGGSSCSEAAEMLAHFPVYPSKAKIKPGELALPSPPFSSLIPCTHQPSLLPPPPGERLLPSTLPMPAYFSLSPLLPFR